jgi:site-specific recombinase XerD
MPIKEVSNYNIKEVCVDLNIDYDDLLLLINKKSIIKTNLCQHTEPKAIYVIEEFIKHIFNQLEIQKISKNTLKYYLSFLTRLKSYILEKDLLFTQMNEEMIYEIIDTSKKIERSTINTYIGIMKRLCTFAEEKGHISKDLSFKFKKIKVSYLPRYFTTDQLNSIFEIAEQRRCTLLWKTIFLTLLGTGLRVKELEQLRIKDVNFSNQFIFTLGKGNKERYIPLYPEIKISLLHYLKETGVVDLTKAKDGYLFSRNYGYKRDKPVTVRSIQYNLSEIREKLELDAKYTVHSFRHTFAVNCLKTNMKLLYLSQILGHESPSTTALYTKLLPKDLQTEMFEKYPIPLEELVKQLIAGETDNGNNDERN